MNVDEYAMAEARRRTDAICEKHYAYMDKFQGRREKAATAEKGRGVPASAGCGVDSAAPYINRPRGGGVKIPVVAIYPNGREKRFASAKDAGIKFGCRPAEITRAIRGTGGYKTAQGLRWKYANDAITGA